MRKILVSILTTALVAGAASTTFAAANPFADVPADHWAYDAVAQLVQEGVVNGYAADGTFKGGQKMSRYEMAQIVAKAMAKAETVDNNTKAQIDKLAAEFSDELSNLGLRVANLEDKVDNVKWDGLVRFDWSTTNFEESEDHRSWAEGSTTNNLIARFNTTATINKNWKAISRTEYTVNKDNSSSSTGTIKRLYAEGKYGKLTTKLGKFGTFSTGSHGLVFDTEITGAEFLYAPNSTWKLKGTAGRYKPSGYLAGGTGSYNGPKYTGQDNATYWAIEADYAQGKWDGGIGYHTLMDTVTNQSTNEKKSSFHIIDLGAGYAFDRNVKLIGDIAWGPALDFQDGVAENISKNAYSVELKYKGANSKDKGSWGVYVAYRQSAPFASIHPTHKITKGNYGLRTLKGWEIGGDYTFARNIIATARFFKGKDTMTNDDNRGDKVTGVWTRVDFIF